MKTLILYTDEETGDPVQYQVEHDNTAQLDLIERRLPKLDEGSAIFFIPFEGERPDVLDETLKEVSCNFLDVRV